MVERTMIRKSKMMKAIDTLIEGMDMRRDAAAALVGINLGLVIAGHLGLDFDEIAEEVVELSRRGVEQFKADRDAK